MVRPFRRHRQLLPRRRPLSVGKFVTDHVLVSPFEDEPRGPAQRERVAAAQGRLGPNSERQATGRGVLVEEGGAVLAVQLAWARGIIGLCNDFKPSLTGHLTEKKSVCAYGFTRYKEGNPISSVYSLPKLRPVLLEDKNVLAVRLSDGRDECRPSAAFGRNSKAAAGVLRGRHREAADDARKAPAILRR